MSASRSVLVGFVSTFLFLASSCSLQSTVPPTAPEPPPLPTSLPTDTPLPPSPSPIPSDTPTPAPTFSDDFLNTLQPGWTWIRENSSRWSLASEPGFLRIVLEGGRYHRNILLREVSRQDFDISTRVEFTPTSNFQIAGLIVYADDSSMIKLGRAFCNVAGNCVGNGIYFDSMQNGQLGGPNYATETSLQDEAYLRINKTGSLFTAYYSEDGEDWVAIGEHEAEMPNPKVGVFAGQSNVVGAAANFDYFTLQEGS